MSQAYLDMQLLRFITAGSVDDGKSTLIGRLLYDSKSIFADQMDAIKSASERRGNDEVNLALLTDGLRAEREQGITIDVAYRYFATPKRKFIIADTPGHVEYTRNMVTGASTADAAVIMIDARHGVLEQTRRHSYIVSLLGIKQVIIAVNKMDLVDFSEDTFLKIKHEYLDKVASHLNLKNIVFIPISAKNGDNVVKASENMPWYQGQTVLSCLETLPVQHDLEQKPFRFPVQIVIRPQSDEFHDYRAYAGRIASGTIKVGDAVEILPSGTFSKVKALDFAAQSLTHAEATQSIAIRLEDNVDVSRGSLIVKRDEPAPKSARQFKLKICWLNHQPLKLNTDYIVRQSTAQTRGRITAIDHKVNINTLDLEPASAVVMNDIAEVSLKTASVLNYDAYTDNRVTGSLILIDPVTYETVGAGMLEA